MRCHITMCKQKEAVSDKLAQIRCLPSLSYIRHTATLDRLIGVGLARELAEIWPAGPGQGSAKLSELSKTCFYYF